MKDGSHPAFLYAYGSYGYPLPVSFSSNRLSLLDRGFHRRRAASQRFTVMYRISLRAGDRLPRA